MKKKSSMKGSNKFINTVYYFLSWRITMHIRTLKTLGILQWRKHFLKNKLLWPQIPFVYWTSVNRTSIPQNPIWQLLAVLTVQSCNVIKEHWLALNMDGSICHLAWPLRLIYSGFLETCAVKILRHM